MSRTSFSESYMQYGFYIFVVVVLLIFVLMYLFYMTPEREKQMKLNGCFNSYDCRMCVYTAYCNELGMEFNQIILKEQIICSMNFKNITSMDFTFNIINRTALKERYADC
jgi:hypothetical protein